MRLNPYPARKLWLGCLIVLFFAPLAVAADPVRIKLAMVAPKGSIFHRVSQEMGEAFRNAEGPGSAFIIYPDGSQGGEADVVRRMRIGQLNAAMLTAVGLSEIDGSAAAMQNVPMLFRSVDEVEYAGAVLRPEIGRRFLDKGFVVLVWAEAGWVRFFSKQPASVPADLKVMRMWAWSGDAPQVEIMKTLGYRPVVLETADIVPGLQTGLIDTVPVTPFWALATQIDRLAPNMVDVKWAPIVGALVINRSTWDAMTQAGRDSLRHSALQAGAELRTFAESSDAEAIAAMEKRGLRVQHMTPETEVAWQRQAEQVYPLIRGHTVPAATFDEAVRLVGEYRRMEKH